MKRLFIVPMALLALSAASWAIAQTTATPTVTYGSPLVWSTPVTQPTQRAKKHRHVHAVPTPISSNTAGGKIMYGGVNPQKAPSN